MILAGGRSSRLGGVDKATLALPVDRAVPPADRAVPAAVEAPRTLVAHAVAQVAGQGVDPAHIVVVGPDSLRDHLPEAVRVVRESPPFAGPAAAVAAGARELSGVGLDHVYVLACDMPQVDAALRALREAAADSAADVLLARTVDQDGRVGEREPGFVQFLLGLVRAEVLAARAATDDFVNAPAKALYRGLDVAHVDVEPAVGDDVDTWSAAAGFGLSATHPTWSQAMHVAASCVGALPVEHVSLREAVGRVTGEEVLAVRAVPHYDSSAMDGFAVSGPGPWVLDDRPADTAHGAGASLAPGSARRILTGGAMPGCATGVVRSEFALVEAGVDGADPLVRPRPDCPDSEMEPGRHIRRAGREAQPGDLVVPRETVVTPAHVAYAAVNGFDTLPVVRTPRVALLYTGDEVLTSGVPEAGQVRDAFGPQMSWTVGRLGGAVVAEERIGDTAEATRAALERFGALGVDVVVTTGATGRSDADHVRRVVEAWEGFRPVFPEIDVRPGHPTMIGFLGGPVHVGLPGNPLAAMVALRLVLVPVLRSLRGLPAAEVPAVPLATDHPAWKVDKIVPGRRLPDGAWEPVGAAGSNMLRGLAEADGLLVLPKEGAARGERVGFLDLPW